MAYPYSLTEASQEQDYLDNIYSLEVGDVFQFKHPMQFETVVARIERYKPVSPSVFNIEYCPAGGQHYTMYGANTAVVTKKTV